MEPAATGPAPLDMSLSETRSFSVGHVTLQLTQLPHASGSLRPLATTSQQRHTAAATAYGGVADAEEPDEGVDWGDGACFQVTGSSSRSTSSWANLGLVAWQSGFLLAELLLRRPPFRQWADVAVVDLGTGTGLVGVALALAGARSVVLSDVRHVLPLAAANAAANCGAACVAAANGGHNAHYSHSNHDSARIHVVEHSWGADTSSVEAALLSSLSDASSGGASGGPASGSCPHSAAAGKPDVITGADLLYDPSQHKALVSSVARLSAPHTVTYLSYRVRRGGGEAEASFVQLLAAAGFAVEVLPDSWVAEALDRLSWAASNSNTGGGGGSSSPVCAAGVIGLGQRGFHDDDGGGSGMMMDDHERTVATAMLEDDMTAPRLQTTACTPAAYRVLRACRLDAHSVTTLD